MFKIDCTPPFFHTVWLPRRIRCVSAQHVDVESCIHHTEFTEHVLTCVPTEGHYNLFLSHALFVLSCTCQIHNTSMLVMDIGTKNALQSVLVPKFLYYSHILPCLLHCLLYYPTLLEFYFRVQIVYSCHDLWSLCSTFN